MNNADMGEKRRPLWDRILALVEEDLAERGSRKVTVEVHCETGPREKEIGELSAQEFRRLDPELREYAAETLLDRYLAEKGRVDLLERRHAYTKDIQDLTPADVPALIAADRYKAEELNMKHERKEFAREVQAELDQLCITQFAEIS